MSPLLPVDKIITAAKIRGVRFSGDPKIHLAYLTKIGLLPSATRRKIDGNLTGCYPSWTVSRLVQIENWKSQGLSYSQMRLAAKNPSLFSPSSDFHLQNPSSLFPPLASNALIYLVLGLFLGYFLALATFSQNLAPTLLSGLPIARANQSMLRIVPTDTKSGNNIYIIALPRQNFQNLGQTPINLAN